MKLLGLLLAICSTGTLFSQTLSEANTYFDNFDYTHAFEIYHKISKTEELSNESLKRYVYSGYVSGEFEKSKEPSESLIQGGGAEPYFHYLHGEICFGTGDFEDAKASFVKYQSLDDEYDVSVKIKACDERPTWKAEDYVTNEPFSDNTELANITGSTRSNGSISLHESEVKDETVFADLIVCKPYISMHGETPKEITIESDLNQPSIISFELVPHQSKALFTVVEPLHKNAMHKAPHIYIGDWNPELLTVSNVTPWMHSGFGDTSVCAHPTVNSSGTQMAFSKIKYGSEASDIYTSHFKDGNWSKPTPITEINTSFNEVFPVFQGDSMLTYSSDGRPGYGNLDIFTFNLKTKEIAHPKSPINSNMDDFNLIYFEDGDSAIYTSNRQGGSGDDDRYAIKIKEEVIIEVPDSTDYYAFLDKWENQTVYFEFDRYDLLHDVKILDEIIAFLGKYEDVKLILDAHSDRRGEKNYNHKLSEKRAKEVRHDLVALGIASKQIELNAYGESKPVLDCRTCTEKMHQENRVVIIKLKAK